MIVLSRDGEWLRRLERLALRGGWPFEARGVVPLTGLAAPPEMALAVLDRSLAGAVPRNTVLTLRSLYPGTAIILSFAASEMNQDAVADAVSCGVDELLAKSWSDVKISRMLASLRDRALASQTQISADGALKAERRAHRAHIKSRGRWRELPLDAGGFALLWRLLEREGEALSRAELGTVLAGVLGRELEPASVSRRLAVLKKMLSSWGGRLESGRGGQYLLSSSSPKKS
ncbi:MAG: hypothetical protein COV48_12035 [Elusimicrobia bacterium CG11_big_fil_rev_8_21_14_0_20_64_6]|nr:MAG: hypothetical protein COV48_12035 [Elusimicrobia bacterium CG11_big_fil_rev_8_21_14_0_20_64_6]